MSVTKDVVYDKSAPMPSIEMAYNHALPNCPGMSIVTLIVTFAPGGATPPHRHGGASVAAVVLEGSVYNKMNDEPTNIVEKDGSWFECPGCHHRTSANVSKTEGAKIVATMVVETKVVEEGGLGALVVIDEEYRQ